MTDIPEYDDLKLRIEPGEGKSYRVTAFGPSGSTATGSFTKPLSELELDNFVLRVGLPRRSVRAARSPQMEDEAKPFGKRLFESLMADEVGGLYRGARRVADSSGRGLRVTLYLTNVPELMEIPWEYLYDPSDRFFLSQWTYTPLVRSLDLPSALPPRELTLPITILGIASAPEGFAALDVAQEREKLEAALEPLTSRHGVKLDWLESATLVELNRRVFAQDSLHVIHYIGHGAYDKRTEGGVLVLEDRDGRPDEVTGEDLGTLLRNERSLRLVVLNSCEGARTSHVDPFSGVASSLLRCGLPAVVGMQAEITDEAAIAFAERFYTALALGYPIDVAMTQARTTIFAARLGLEFGTPVLFLRGEETRLFRVDGTERLDTLPEPAPAEPKPEEREPEEREREEREREEREEREREERERVGPTDWRARLRRALPWVGAAVGVLAAAALAVALLTGGDDINDTVAVGLDPVDVVAGAGALWTSNNLGGDISKVDPENGEEVDRIELRAVKPSAIAIGAGYLWVADVQNNRLVRVNLATGDHEPVEIDGEAKPSGVAVGDGSVWVALFTKPGQLVQIDPRTRDEINRFPVGNRPEDVKVANGAVWVTSSTTNVVTRIGLSGGETTEVPIDYRSDDAAVYARALWVTNRDDGRITRIDLGDPGNFDSFRVGELPEGIAVDGRNVWVVNEADEEVIRLDAHEPSRELGRYPVGQKPSDVAVDDAGIAWVANTGDDTLSRIEP
jgi:streptogramin lyase